MRSKVRKYGDSPFLVMVLHGGPGGGGELQPVAEMLCKSGISVLEPIFRQRTIAAQLKYLKQICEKEKVGKIILIGHSWGAMLGWIFSAKYPNLIKKLVMIASGEFDVKFVPKIMQIRNDRMNNKQKVLYKKLIENKVDNKLMAEIGEFLTKIDSFKTIDDESVNEIKPDSKVFTEIWNQLEKLRQSGEFLAMGKNIKCPIVVIHGDYDPHPIEGIIRPIESVNTIAKQYILEKCGHYPWREKYAKDIFFRIILDEMVN